MLRRLCVSVRAPGYFAENAHAAVNRKCSLRLLDGPPLRWLVKLNKESSKKGVRYGVVLNSVTAADSGAARAADNRDT